jgi:hypothetical protein
MRKLYRAKNGTSAVQATAIQFKELQRHDAVERPSYFSYSNGE